MPDLVFIIPFPVPSVVDRSVFDHTVWEGRSGEDLSVCGETETQRETANEDDQDLVFNR